MYNQNDIEYLKDMTQQKKMTVAEANVELVRMQRVRVVNHLPSDVRKALNEAVKNGTLGHLKKRKITSGSLLSSKFQISCNRRT